LGVSRRWIKRLAAIGLLDEDAQSFERIVGLASAVEVMAELDVHSSDESIACMVEQVADALRKEPSGLDLHLRVVGSFFEVGDFEHLTPDSALPFGTIHSISFLSWVATARRQLIAARDADSR
jgi:hypothetical protein